MKKALIVIDMQNDFVTGSLANKAAEKIVEPIVKKIKEYDGTVILTRDTHTSNYLKTAEGKSLPVEHCIQGSSGWEIVDKIAGEAAKKKDNRIINKPTFGLPYSFAWNLEEYSSVEIVGTCTDICVVSNALILKALYPDLQIKVLSDMCAGLTKEKHEAALEVMRSCQIEVI